MLRLQSIQKYEFEVRNSLYELLDLCWQNKSCEGDLLLCQQNGYIDSMGNIYVGMGEEGLNCMQKINSISVPGIGEKTDDNDYFSKNGNTFFKGVSELEKSIHREKSIYLDIWENTYFLRMMTQIINILNKCDYDWYLNTSNFTPGEKSKHIRKQIIQRLNLAPKFKQIVQTAYVGQIRNAIAHSQYHIIPRGICYDNCGYDKYMTLQGLSFEDWEQKYIYSYLIFVGLFQTLQQLSEKFYVPLSQNNSNKGILVKIPNKKKGWSNTYLYPNKEGNIWRFVKI